MTASSVSTGHESRGSLAWRELGVFLAIAFALPWTLWLLRLVTGVDLVAAGGMASVGLATLVTVLSVNRPASIRHDTGLVPLHPGRRLARDCGLAFLGWLLLGAAAVGIGALVGVYPTDVTGFSGLRAVYAPETLGGHGLPGDVLLTALTSCLGLFLALLPLAFCEEWAWRGFLLTRLMQLGRWPALLITGLVWGLWHAPGYVGPGAQPGLAPFLIMAILFGVLLGWLRLATGTIWPGVVAHAANNTLVTGFVNVVVADASLTRSANPWTTGLNGWPGWLVMLAVITTVTLTGAIRSASTPRT